MTSLASEVEGAVLSAAASIMTLYIGYRKGFFSSWRSQAAPTNPPTLLLVLGSFAIYYFIGVSLPALLDRLLFFYSLDFMSERIAKLTWITFLTNGSTLLGLFILCRSIYRPIWKTIWRRQSTSLKSDALYAFAACLISFPLVLFVGQLLEIAVYFIFHTFQLPDQIVIMFLKMTFGQPLCFFLATLSIILFAPMIEEVIFRGFLQSYLRRYLGPNPAILLSSMLFAVFHYSNDQGQANIPILGSLFILAYFLGFVYERRGSLFAPMILHATFNAISTTNLYFLGD